jgi:hypothetical protein
MGAESGGNANAVNQNTDGSFDVGLWQINGWCLIIQKHLRKYQIDWYTSC